MWGGIRQAVAFCGDGRGGGMVRRCRGGGGVQARVLAAAAARGGMSEVLNETHLRARTTSPGWSLRISVGIDRLVAGDSVPLLEPSTLGASPHTHTLKTVAC